MKKIFLLTNLLFLILFLIPILVSAQQPLVPCNGIDCTINSFFVLLGRIFFFVVFYVATPLAVLMLTIGGIMILISGGKPNLAGSGRKILWVAIIGLVLVFCSWLIVNFILCEVLKYCSWNIL